MLPWVCWIWVIKDVLYELHWLFQLQSRSSHRRGNDGYERKSIRWIDRKMGKAQRQRSRFSSCSPGFNSHSSQELHFNFILDAAEINQWLYLELSSVDRTHLVQVFSLHQIKPVPNFFFLWCLDLSFTFLRWHSFAPILLVNGINYKRRK